MIVTLVFDFLQVFSQLNAFNGKNEKMKTVFNMKNNNNNTTTKMNFSHWNIWALSKCTHALLLCKIHHKMKKNHQM